MRGKEFANPSIIIIPCICSTYSIHSIDISIYLSTYIN
jgi:hypothetical protein